MHQINGRGTFWTSKLCLPHLLKSSNPHVLNLSPPLDLDPRWFKMGGVAYTMAKYNMSMCALGMAEEFKGQVAFNCLWPRTAIATAAIKMLAGELGVSASRSVDIMADAAHWILTQRSGECSGNTFIDDEVLTQRAGMSEADLDKYPGTASRDSCRSCPTSTWATRRRWKSTSTARERCRGWSAHSRPPSKNRSASRCRSVECRVTLSGI